MTRDKLRRLIREVIAETTEDLQREVSESPRKMEKEIRMTLTDGILTEKQLRAAAQGKVAVIDVGASVIVTPLARDAARQRGIRIKRID